MQIISPNLINNKIPDILLKLVSVNNKMPDENGNINLEANDLGLSTVLILKDYVDTESDLQNISLVEFGDVYGVSDTNHLFVYTENGWIDTGSSDIDLSNYNTVAQEIELHNQILDEANAYTDSHTSGTIVDAMRYKGNKNTFEELPAIAASTIGDVWSIANKTFYILDKTAHWTALDNDNFTYYVVGNQYTEGQIILGPDDVFYRIKENFTSTDWDKDKDLVQVIGATGLGVYRSTGTMSRSDPNGTVICNIVTPTFSIAQKKNGDYCSLAVRSATGTTMTALISTQEWYGTGAEQVMNDRVILTDSSDFIIDPDNGYGASGTNGQTLLTNILTGEQFLIFGSGSSSTTGLGFSDKYSLVVIPLNEVNIGIPQGDMEAGVVTDNTLFGDGTPSNPLSAQNSLIKKSDVYVIPSSPVTKSLPDLEIGEDISGGVLTFPSSGVQWPGASPFKAIIFEDASYWGCANNGTSWGLFDATDTMIYEAVGINGVWNDTVYVLPDDKIVYSVNATAFSYVPVGNVNVTYTPPSENIDCEWLYNEDRKDDEDFLVHKNGDISRWVDVYQTQRDTYVLESKVEGKILNDSSQSNPDLSVDFTVTDEFGGLLEVVMSNTEDDYCVVKINDQPIYNMYGMPPNQSITKYYNLNYNDEVNVNMYTTSIYTPYVPDIESITSQMYESMQSLTKQVSIMQTQILDLKSGIDGKTLNAGDSQDITNITFTVPDELGGRVNGQGIRVLSVLGVTVISTGTVTLDGNTIYDNSSLLGVGPASILNTDVAHNSIIISTGMDNLSYTPYVMGT